MSTNYYVVGLTTIITILSNSHRVSAQDEHCPCDDPNSDSSWGTFVGVGANCEGTCNAASRQSTRICHLDSLNRITVCDVRIPCESVRPCESTWGPWFNAGPCSATCEGMRRQARTCYKVTSSGQLTNRRDNLCIGGSGLSDQQRFTPCRSNRCPTAPTSTTPTTTTETIVTVTSTTGSSTSSPLVQETTGSETEQLITTPTSTSTAEGVVGQRTTTPPPVNVLILATVLGSVSIVSFAVIVVVAIFCKRRSRDDKQGHALQTLEPHGPHRSIPITDVRQEERNDYESIAPALPPMRTNQLENPRANPVGVYQGLPIPETSLQASGDRDGSGYFDRLTSSQDKSLDNIRLEEDIYVSIN